jgi:hypothetical protein
MAVFLTGARAGRCLGWRSALIAGALFGLGYIMRYSVAVVAGVTGVWLLFDIRNWPRRDGLANLLAFVLGFLVTAAVQMIPSMLETGSPVTGILPKMFWMAYEWETKHIPYGLLYERYRDMPMQQLLPEMLSIKFQLALYYLDHLKVELITGSPHVWGPAVAVVAYPAIAVATWRIGSARRSGLAYILFVGLAVMLFHGLVVYAARYLLITIPAVLVCLVLAARELSVLIAQFAEPRRLRSAARAVLMVGLILWLGVNLFAEARVLAMREANQRYLAPVAEQMGKAATSARQVGTVFMPCAAYYDTTSRFYDEIPLQPGATIAELRTEMRNTGRQFVIVDKCSGNLYPTLASAFLSSATLEGFTRVFAFPAEKPFVTAFRLTDANNTDLSTGSNQ